MDKGLYIAMTGAKHNMYSQTAHSNNLANVNTAGFKADFAQARSMGVYYGDGHSTRAYALSENPATDLSDGPLIQTGRDLDIAVEGRGYITIQTPDGGEAYTRASSFYVDSAGILRTGNELPVMGNGGPIAIPAAEKIEVALDGTISVIPLGEDEANVAVIDRIKLVNPDNRDLKKGEDGLIRPLDPEADIPPDAEVSIVTGFIEGSNVNAVNEMTTIMSLARQYEMQVKMMQTMEKNSEASAKLLQMS